MSGKEIVVVQSDALKLKALVAKRLLEEVWQADPQLFKQTVAQLIDIVPTKGAFGHEFWLSIARKSNNIAFEAIPMRRNRSGEFEFFMRLRSAKECFQNEWHFIGSYLRPWETEQETADRLEFNGTKGIHFVRIAEVWDIARGNHGYGIPSISWINLVWFDEEPKEDETRRWFSANRLPANMQENHRLYYAPLALRACQTSDSQSIELVYLENGVKL
ncbi:hypothetical protein EPN28_00495 [Patescibacteria group bacterium]|nr:MAG: hypothetical protein EPN28_00495 [Patescibacteria group bacterium]